MKIHSKTRPLHTRLYRYWQALYLAFYAPTLYIDVARHWRGVGLRYLFLLIALGAFPFSMRLMGDMHHYLNDIVLAPIAQLPVLDVQKGQLHFERDATLFVRDRAGTLRGILTPTGDFATWQARFPELELLITRDALFFQWPPLPVFFLKQPVMAKTTPVVQSFHDIHHDIFVGKTWVQAAPVVYFRWVVLGLMYPFVLFFFFGGCISLLLVLGFLGQVIARVIFKYHLTFKVSCRLMAVSATAPMSVFFVMITCAFAMPPWIGTFYMGLLAIYFSYALLCIRRTGRALRMY